MTLTASDVASLSKTLSCWEYAEYAFATLVAVACAGEYVAEFTNWFTGGIKEAQGRLAKRSTLLLIAALAFELVCLVRTNSLSGQLIGSLSDKAENADQKAQSAIDKSGIAEDKATAAVSKANESLGKVDVAKESAGRAKDEADAASQEAESLSQYLATVTKLVNPRHLDRAKFMDLMSGQPKATAVIQYELFDTETEIFATELSTALGKKGLGWDSTLQPFPSTPENGILSPKFALRYVADTFGIACAVKTEDSKEFNDLRETLFGAIGMSLGVNGKGGIMPIVAPSLPENTFVIGIGHHIINLPAFEAPKLKTKNTAANKKK